MWNVPRLFHYSLDHFKRQFDARKVHPVIVLAIARENGIPGLIKPAVEALAEPAVSLHSWCCNNDTLRYTTQVDEVSAIARMRERLYAARLSILDVPPAIHGKDCADVGGCGMVWEHYWHTRVGKKIRRLFDGAVSNQLWFIRSDILRTQIPGMRQSCSTMTVEKVGAHSCWYVDRQIIDSAIEYLIVDERVPNWHVGLSSDSN